MTISGMCFISNNNTIFTNHLYKFVLEIITINVSS